MVAVNTQVLVTVVLLGFVKRIFGVCDRRLADLDGDGGGDNGGVATNDRRKRRGREPTGTDHCDGWRVFRPRFDTSTDLTSLLRVWR